MLIDKPYTEGDTITFKTIAGEEVVARLEKKDQDSIRVKKPMALTAAQGGIGMVPFTFTVAPDTPLEINLATVVFIAKTDSAMASQYIESTTGIKITN